MVVLSEPRSLEEGPFMGLLLRLSRRELYVQVGR